jgi:hypothetical protein
MVDIPEKICPKWQRLVKGLYRKWEKFSQTQE